MSASKYRDGIPDELIAWFDVAKTQKQTISMSKRYNKEGTLISEEEKYKVVPNDLPTFEGFARSIDVSQRTLEKWYLARVSDEPDAVLKYPLYVRAYNVAKALQKAFLVDNGLQGNSPPATTIFILKNVTDMTDKTIVETKDSDLESKRDALDNFLDTLRNDADPKPAE